MTVAYRRATLLAAVLLLASLAPVALRVAQAAGGRGAGLLKPYTFTGCDKTKPTDPINVIWYQALATPANVADQLWYMGWKHNDYDSPLANLFGAIDYQYVKEVGGCFRDDRQAATGTPISTRYHVRLFSTVNARGTGYVGGDAHHDKVIIGQGCKKALGHAGHIADSFNVPRERIAQFWPDPTTKYRFWGNTRRMRQCNASYTASDGYVAYLRTNIATIASHTYHPDAVERPTISGTPAEGQTLTAGTGTWSDPGATSFRYQWCVVNLATDACANIGGATSVTWVAPAGSAGRVIAVKVRPVGASTTDTALGGPVTIGAPSGSPPTLTVGGGSSVNPDIAVTTGGLDTAVTWIARFCSQLDADGHPSSGCLSGSTVISGSVGSTVLSGFGQQDACNNVDYWVKATNAAGTVWSAEIVHSSSCV
ncbi:MAG: hypothetical protein QOI62_3337 [Solirubrobacteraceae bacterium]|jgi:hypothetical protein|nr:hypothetical protein [Solirubrobacteraceae bacterium]